MSEKMSPSKDHRKGDEGGLENRRWDGYVHLQRQEFGTKPNDLFRNYLFQGLDKHICHHLEPCIVRMQCLVIT